MTLPFDDYLRHLQSGVTRFDEVWATADPDAMVPSCPEWSAQELRDHVAEVLAFWHAQLLPGASVEGPGPVVDDGTEVARAVADLGHDIIATLRRIGPDQPCWNWSGVDQVSGWVARRMAQELAVHRVDAELVTGDVTAIAPALAADGIDELVDVFVDAEPGADTAGAPVLAIHSIEPARHWTIAVTDDGVLRVDRPETATLRGTASDLLLTLWSRPSGATWSGDEAAATAWRELARFV